MVLYELLTGVCAFRGQSLQSILAAHLTGAPVPFSESDPKEHIPLGLRRALIRALEIQPEERFQTAEEFLAEINLLPQRPTPEETHEFLLLALGRPQEPTDGPIVELPAPGTNEIEPRTEAGGKTVVSGSSAVDAGAPAWPPTRVLKTGAAAAEEGRPAPERTELYRPSTIEVPAEPARPARSHRYAYAAILGAAAIGLALLWLLKPPPPEKISTKTENREPTAPSVASTAPVPTAIAPGGSFPLPPGSGAISEPSPAIGTSPVPAPTIPPEPTASPIAQARRSTTAGAPRGRRDRDAQPPGGDAASDELPKPAPTARASPAAEPKTFYCATLEKTSYSQGAIKEPPRGFAPDAPPALRGPRTDAARIHIDVTIRPEKPGEGEPFRVTARVVNDGDMDLILERAEESAERQDGGFRPVEGRGSATVAQGGFFEIYRFEGRLAGGATYRKDLRVIDRFGDSWRTSIRMVPCE